MPVVTFHNEHRSVDVDPGINLRALMLKVGVTPYQGISQLTNCRGHNFCGTCAVAVVDGKGGSPRSQDEEATLAGNLLIAKTVDKNLRLSCQTTIVGDMVVKTHPVRVVDTKKTKERVTLTAIGCFFLLVFGGMLVVLLLDMIEQL